VSTPPRLWAVTPPAGEPALACVDAWPAGAELGLWLRTPGASPRATALRCAAIVERAHAVGVPIVVGCDAVAIIEAAACVRELGLAGVVLRGDPSRAALERARAALGDRAWIGRSTHAIADDHALVDWTVLGPIFAPHTAKPQGATPLGTDVLARAGARVVAIGGIDRHTAAACVAAGAWGLAGIRSFFGPPDEVAEDVAVLHALLQPAKHGQTSS
jgi:thiamine monophosphate synthase